MLAKNEGIYVKNRLKINYGKVQDLLKNPMAFLRFWYFLGFSELFLYRKIDGSGL
jgi:hypothetical protein